MNSIAEEKIPTVDAVSDEHKEEIRDEFDDLDIQEGEALKEIADANRSMEQATARLTTIKEERLKLVQELLDCRYAQQEPFELTPAMADEAINALKEEFEKGAHGAKEAGYLVQEGLDFASVEAKLRANKDALVAVYRMVRAESRPALVCQENGRFCIAETFGQILSERANCVYDRKAAKLVGRENCNGNAVDQARGMGISLMERRIADAYLTAFPDSNQYCFDYIQATEKERKSGGVPCVYRAGGEAVVGLRGARDRRGDRGWRGALWF